MDEGNYSAKLDVALGQRRVRHLVVVCLIIRESKSHNNYAYFIVYVYFEATRLRMTATVCYDMLRLRAM